MEKETIYGSKNDENNGFSESLNSNLYTIKEIEEICEFCNEEDSTEIAEANNIANQKSANCLFKEIRGIDSTNPL